MTQNSIIFVVFIILIGFLLVMKTQRGGSMISGNEAKTMVEDGVPIIDVRTREEYKGGHVPGAFNRPLGDSWGEELPKDLNSPVIVYCQSGNRSGQAKSSLERMGYTQVYNMGGVSRWPGNLEVGEK